MNGILRPRLIRSRDEFEALPDDGVERWVIRGELRELRDAQSSHRNRFYSLCMANANGLLANWLRGQDSVHGEVVCGQAGFYLRQNPITLSAGVDVAVITEQQSRLDEIEDDYFHGAPLLLAEVLSPSDTIEGISERVTEYLACGMPVVWIMNPYQRYLTIHRKSLPTIALGGKDTLNGAPELPGFVVPVADFFR